MVFAKKYLVAFGYVNECQCSNQRLCTHVSTGLRHFQKFTKLTPNGALSLETLRMMKRPRCPVPDFEPGEIGGPGIEDSDPFVFSANTWNRNELRWFLLVGTGGIMTGEANIIQQEVLRRLGRTDTAEFHEDLQSGRS